MIEDPSVSPEDETRLTPPPPPPPPPANKAISPPEDSSPRPEIRARHLPPSPPSTTVPGPNHPPQRATSNVMVDDADFWVRALALLIDQLIISVAAFFVGGLLASMALDTYSTARDVSAAVIFIYLAATIGGWLYYALQESGAAQATLGKKAMGIKVVDQSGRRIEFSKATGRYFGKYLSGLVLGLGFLMAGFTHRKQALHDMLAGTYVIK